MRPEDIRTAKEAFDYCLATLALHGVVEIRFGTCTEKAEFEEIIDTDRDSGIKLSVEGDD